MIKIVHLITGLGMGGAEKQLFQLVTYSDPLRFKHIIISMMDKGVLGDKMIEKGITVHTLNMVRGRVSIMGFLRLIKILKKERPQILQTWLYHADLLGLLVGKIFNIPKIVWNIRCSNMDTQHYAWLTSLVIKLCAVCSRFPNKLVVNSNAGKEAHERLGYDANKWINIPNGFMTEHLRPDPTMRNLLRKELNLSEEDILIGMIARFDPMKDHISFLRAAKKLSSSDSNDNHKIHFILIGTNVDNHNVQLISEIKKLGLQDSVHLLGKKDNVVEYLNALDIKVLSSAYGEGFPNVLGEAMACGVPCVATDVGDSAIIIGETGKIVPPNDSNQLAVAITELLKLGKEKRQALGVLARERIVQRYHIQTLINQYDSLYQSLCI